MGKMPMGPHAKCSECNSALPSDAPEGLCPQCLIKAVLDNHSDVASPSPTDPPRFMERNELPDSRPSNSSSGDSIPGYEVIREIHRGGQGVVYQAIQKATKRRVAIKVMRQGPFSGPQERSRFEREVRILAALRHPHIVSVHDSGTASGSFYFTMDYIPGDSLDRYVQQHNPSLNDVLRLFAKVCEAVNAAHLRGIIHRDLKPANIRVDPQGEPHILDFGLARIALGGVTEESQPRMMTITGEFVGSPPWASPEQAEGLHELIDVRTDVYALGVIFFQILTGRFPYEVTGNVLDVLERVRSAEPIRPSTLRRDLGDEIETIILKCLAKDRERRYQSAGELARDIARYLAGDPIEAKRDSMLYVMKKTLRRHWLPVAVAAAFVTLVSVSLVISASLWYRAQRNFLAAEQGRRAAEEAQTLADAKTREAEASAREAKRRLYSRQMVLAQQASEANSVSFRHLLDQCPEEFRGWEWYRLLRLSDRSSMTLAAHEGNVQCIAFSPDGRWMASAGVDPMLRLWTAETGKLERELRRPDEWLATVAFNPAGDRIVLCGPKIFEVWDPSAWRPAWTRDLGQSPSCALFSPDGRQISVGLSAGSVLLLNAETGNEIRALRGNRDHVNAISYAPDGQRLAATSCDGAVRIWDTTSGTLLHALKGHEARVFGVAFSPDGQHLASVGEDKTVRIWDSHTGSELLVLRGHTLGVDAVTFSADGSRLCSGGRDATLRLWNAATGNELSVLSGHARSIYTVAFSPDGKSIASGGQDTAVKVWDSASEGDERTISASEGTLSNIYFSADGQRLAAYAKDAVAVWDAATGRRLEPVGDEACPCMVSADGRHRMRFAWLGEVYIEDIETGKSIRIQDDPHTVQLADFSPDGQTLTTRATDGMLQVWDVVTGALLRSAQVYSMNRQAFAYSPDGKRVATCSQNGMVRFWDARTLQPLVLALEHPTEVNGATFSPDGSRIVTVGTGGVRVWDAETGDLLSAFGDAPDRVYREVAFSSNGHTIAAVCNSDDPTTPNAGIIKVWHVPTSHAPSSHASSGEEPATTVLTLEKAESPYDNAFGGQAEASAKESLKRRRVALEVLKSGQPVAGANLVMRRISRSITDSGHDYSFVDVDHPDPTTWTARSDEDGRAAFYAMEVGCYGVEAYTGDACGIEDISLRGIWDVTTETTIDLRPAEPLAGQVLAPDGTPIPDAVIYPTRVQCESNTAFLCPVSVISWSTKTAPDGSFCFPLLFAGKWQMAVRAAGYPDQPTEWLATGNPPVDIRLRVVGASPVTTAQSQYDAGVDMSAYAGKYALIHFWAAWCDNCRREMPNIKAVYEEYKSDPRVIVVGVDLDSEVEKAKSYIADNGLTWAHLFLGDWTTTGIPSLYGVQTIPYITLYDPQGQVVVKNLRGPAIRDAVEKILGNACGNG